MSATLPRRAVGAGAAMALIAAGAYWLTPAGTAMTAGSVAPRPPGKLRATALPDGRVQLVMRLWWAPAMGAPASVQWNVGGTTTVTDVPSAPVRIPFERRSLVPPGTRVTLGVHWTSRRPTGAGWQMWESGQLVRHGETTADFVTSYVVTGA